MTLRGKIACPRNWKPLSTWASDGTTSTAPGICAFAPGRLRHLHRDRAFSGCPPNRSGSIESGEQQAELSRPRETDRLVGSRSGGAAGEEDGAANAFRARLQEGATDGTACVPPA